MGCIHPTASPSCLVSLLSRDGPRGLVQAGPHATVRISVDPREFPFLDEHNRRQIDQVDISGVRVRRKNRSLTRPLLSCLLSCHFSLSNDNVLRKVLHSTPCRRSRRCHRIPGRARETRLATAGQRYLLHRARFYRNLRTHSRRRGVPQPCHFYRLFQD